MKFKVLLAVTRNITIFWCMTSCGLGKFTGVSEELAASMFGDYTEYDMMWYLFNPLAPELFFLILAHSVYKM